MQLFWNWYFLCFTLVRYLIISDVVVKANACFINIQCFIWCCLHPNNWRRNKGQVSLFLITSGELFKKMATPECCHTPEPNQGWHGSHWSKLVTNHTRYLIFSRGLRLVADFCSSVAFWSLSAEPRQQRYWRRGGGGRHRLQPSIILSHKNAKEFMRSIQVSTKHSEEGLEWPPYPPFVLVIGTRVCFAKVEYFPVYVVIIFDPSHNFRIFP